MAVSHQNYTRSYGTNNPRNNKPLVMDNTSVKHHPNLSYKLTKSYSLDKWYTFGACGQQLCKILSISNMAIKSYGPDIEFGYVSTMTLTLETWPWFNVMYNLGISSWHILGSWRQIMWNIFQIQDVSIGVMTWTWIWVCMHWDLDLEDMMLSQGHETTLSHGQKLCETLSRSKMAVRSYDLDMDLVMYALVPWPLVAEVWFFCIQKWELHSQNMTLLACQPSNIPIQSTYH